jgi:hypothetical protein
MGEHGILTTVKMIRQPCGDIFQRPDVTRDNTTRPQHEQPQSVGTIGGTNG